MSKKKRKISSSVVGKRFLRPEQIDEALDELAALASDQHVHVLLAGGVAMQLYGSDRFTKDIDIVSTGPLDGLKEVDDLTFGGVAALTSENTEVDVIVRNDEYQPLYEAALDSPRRIRGVPLPVISREYLAAMKMAAHRGKDFEDLAHLILNTPLSLKRTRQIIVEYLGPYAGREFDSFVEQVQALGRCP
jgi:hypothetical protein